MAAQLIVAQLEPIRVRSVTPFGFEVLVAARRAVDPQVRVQVSTNPLFFKIGVVVQREDSWPATRK